LKEENGEKKTMIIIAEREDRRNADELIFLRFL
jgi:hypothetical protein